MDACWCCKKWDQHSGFHPSMLNIYTENNGSLLVIKILPHWELSAGWENKGSSPLSSLPAFSLPSVLVFWHSHAQSSRHCMRLFLHSTGRVEQWGQRLSEPQSLHGWYPVLYRKRFSAPLYRKKTNKTKPTLIDKQTKSGNKQAFNFPVLLTEKKKQLALKLSWLYFL